MKKSFIAAAAMLLVACHAKNDFSKEQAKTLIQEDLQAVNPATISINSSGEESLDYLKGTKLVQDGYITFVTKPGMFDPKISYSEQANNFLVPPKVKPRSEAEEKYVKEFRTADMVVSEVNDDDIKFTEDGKQVVVKYTYTWSKKTPFFELQRNKEDQTAKAYFKQTDGGWIISKDPSVAQKRIEF